MKALWLTLMLLAASPAWGFENPHGGISAQDWGKEPLPPGAIPIPETPAGGTPWSVFEATSIDYDEDRGVLVAGWGSEVKKIDGQSVKLVGFMIPTSGNRRHKEFMFSKLPPSCPFCPAADPNQMMSVVMKTPIGFTEDAIILRGTFKRATRDEDIQNAMFYYLLDAEVVKE